MTPGNSFNTGGESLYKIHSSLAVNIFFPITFWKRTG